MGSKHEEEVPGRGKSLVRGFNGPEVTKTHSENPTQLFLPV